MKFHFDYTPIIANTSDYGLPSGINWLPVRTYAPNTVEVAAHWAYSSFADKPEDLRALYCAGAVIAIKASLVKIVDGQPDGFWSYTSNYKVTFDAAIHKKIQTYLTRENLTFAASIMVATKADWWLSNLSYTYTTKVLQKIFGENLNDEHLTMAKIIGGWASTIYILQLAGISSLKAVSDLPMWKSTNAEKPIAITIGSDLKHLFKRLPPGTEKLAICYEVAKLFLRCPLARLCPGVEDFIHISSKRAAVLKAPASYHTSALYLTGNPRADYDDTDNEAFMGRLGTYLRMWNPESELAKSAEFTEEKVQSYPDSRDAGILGQIRAPVSEPDYSNYIRMGGGKTHSEMIQIREKFFSYSYDLFVRQ